MKTTFAALGLAVLTFAFNTPAHASFFQVCELVATVESVERVATLNDNASADPTTKSDTYFKIATLKVTDAVVNSTRPRACAHRIGETHKLVVKQGEEYKAGQTLKINFRQANALTPQGVAMTESWIVIP